MTPRIELLAEKKLIGKHITMSLANNKTVEVWRGFITQRKEIKNNIGTDLYSLQIYDPLYFAKFDPKREFKKWAAIEVGDFEEVPAGMEPLILPEGMYAVFLYKGAASAGQKTFQYIFETWLPGSEFVLDNRPHFELLGEKYKNEDPDSEEEIWIPIRSKNP